MYTIPQSLRVGVLRGGPSSEYEVSLKTGANVLKELEGVCRVSDIFIDKQGNWHYRGVACKPEKILHQFDVIFNALHGEYGEDGKVQEILESHGTPYTGSGRLASGIGMNKALTKDFYRKAGIKTPQSKVVFENDDIKKRISEIFQTFTFPMVVKPVSSGYSVGVYIVQNLQDLEKVLVESLTKNQSVLVEEFIKGREATCGVVDNFRGEKHYALPPVEIKSHNDFFDYEAKYGGKSEEIVPGLFPLETKKEIEKLAVLAHKVLGLRHYSRSDFIIHPKRGIFILVSNTLPGLTNESLLPKSLASVGAEMKHFLAHIIGLALNKK